MIREMGDNSFFLNFRYRKMAAAKSRKIAHAARSMEEEFIHIENAI